MTRTKSIIGALALCALAICAFGAASASAAKGLTAVTCKNVGVATGELNSHCETGTTGEYKTEALPLNTTTAVESKSTGGEEPALRGTLGGLKVTVKCSAAEQIEPWIKNTEPNTGEHKIDAGAKRITYTGCHAVLMSKETRTCAIEEVTGPNKGTIGMVSTNELESETTGIEHQIIVKPVKEEKGNRLPFAKFNIKAKGFKAAEENECPFNAEIEVEVKGSVEGEANTTNHSHLTFTEANNGKLLEANGGEAKYVDTLGGNMAGEPNTTVGATTFT